MKEIDCVRGATPTSQSLGALLSSSSLFFAIFCFFIPPTQSVTHPVAGTGPAGSLACKSPARIDTTVLTCCFWHTHTSQMEIHHSFDSTLTFSARVCVCVCVCGCGPILSSSFPLPAAAPHIHIPHLSLHCRITSSTSPRGRAWPSGPCHYMRDDTRLPSHLDESYHPPTSTRTHLSPSAGVRFPSKISLTPKMMG